jgi:iron(III) transport system permease protein
LKPEASLPAGAADLETAARPSFSRALRAFFRFNPLWLLILPFILIITGLLFTVFWLSFLHGLPGTPEVTYTLGNYVKLYSDPFVLTALSNTLRFSAMTVAVSLFFGIAIAWLVERTDLPGKSVIYTVMSLSLLLPGFFLAMGWLFLLHPRIGLVNRWIVSLLGLADAPFNISTVLGMGWVQGLSLASLAFILISASFRAMDPALEEAATVHGASFGQMLGRVFIPLMSPGILASALYIFTISIASFDTPAILGLSNRVYTFSTFVYAQTTTGDSLPDYGPTAAMSAFMVALALLLAYWYGGILRKANRYQVVTGKGYRPRRYELGPWTIPAWIFIAAYLLLSKLIPLLLLLWAAGLPFFQPPSLQAWSLLSWQNFRSIPVDLLYRGALNTLRLMVAVPTLALLVSFGFSWMVTRSRSRLSPLLDFFAFLPHAVPGIIFGVGALFVALFVLKGLPLYGSLTLLGIVYVVDRLSFGTRVLNSAFIQIHHELEEAATMCGANGLTAARCILAPLVWPALLNGWLWMALMTYRELTVATVLFTPSNITLPVVVWNIWISGNFGVAAAITLVLLCCLVPLVMIYYLFGRREAPGNRLPG